MSIEALSWVWKQNLPPTHKLVLLAIADHSDQDGVCWPGIRGLAKKTGLSERTINRTLAEIEMPGMVIIEKRTDSSGRNLSNVYILGIPHEIPATDGGRVTGCHPGVSKAAGEGDRVSPKGDGVSPRRVTGCHPNHKIEPSTESPRTEYHKDFVQFWNFYPRKVAKGAALKAWAKVQKEGIPPETILAALGSQHLEDREMQFIPHPSTWLNHRRWEDDPAAGGSSGTAQKLSRFTGLATRDYTEGLDAQGRIKLSGGI